MPLTPTDIARLEDFLVRIKAQTYPEIPALEHTGITRQMMEILGSRKIVAAGMEVLDVGCGQGVAMELFLKLGCKATGITLNSTDVAECRKKGYNVLEMDQSFLDFDADRFDLIWCRHCLEHSIFPYFTLTGFMHILKPGGWLYVEVPAPDTSCNHQANKNHYSVLGKSMWTELLHRAGFNKVEKFDVSFKVPRGPDTYWMFLQQKA